MIDAPDAEDRFAIWHQDRRRVALIGLLSPLSDDGVTRLLIRDVHEWQVGLFFGVRNRNDEGGESQ